MAEQNPDSTFSKLKGLVVWDPHIQGNNNYSRPDPLQKDHVPAGCPQSPSTPYFLIFLPVWPCEHLSLEPHLSSQPKLSPEHHPLTCSRALPCANHGDTWVHRVSSALAKLMIQGASLMWSHNP